MKRLGYSSTCMLLALFFCLPRGNTAAQEKPRAYTATVFKVQDGLPSNSVNSLALNDKKQLLLATQRGLVLFDGYRFSTQDSVRRYIESIAVDGKAIYFHERGRGLALWNPLRPREKNYLARTIYTDSDPNNDHYNNLRVDASGRVWSSDFNQIKCIEPQSKEMTPLVVAEGSQTLVPPFDLLESGKGTYLLTRSGTWLFRAGRFTRPQLSEFAKKSWLASAATKAGGGVAIDARGTFFVLDLKAERLQEQLTQPEWRHARRLLPEGNHYWILSRHSLQRFDAETKEVTTVYQNETVDFNDLLIDTGTQIIWIATDEGLVQLTPRLRDFQTVFLSAQGTAHVQDIHQMDGRLYLLSQNSIYTFQDDHLRKMGELPTGNTPPSKFSIIDGQIWVAVANRIFTIVDDRLVEQHIANIPKEAGIKKIVPTSFDELWLLQESKPVLRVHKHSRKVIDKPFQNEPPFWNENKWNDLVEHHGKLWLAGWMPKSFGVCFYNPEKNRFDDLAETKPNDKELFVGDYFLKISPTAKGQLLMAAFGGWNQVESDGTITKRIDVHRYPIHSDILGGIGATSDGLVYFGTSEGLYLYKPQEDLVYAFTEKEGLPQNNVTYAFRMIDDETLALGIRNGFVLVDLKSLNHTKLLNRFAFSEVTIDGQPMNPEAPIVFRPSNQLLEVKFSALSYEFQNLIRYRYRFSDDEDWIELNHSAISFTHLPYGNYHIDIQAGDHLGNWQEESLSLDIHAVPPFFKSVVFYLLLSLSSIVLTILIARFFIRKAKKENQLQQEVIRSEMKALRSQMNPHFLFNSLNAIHSSIIQEKTEQASTYLGTFSKLLRHILEYTQQENISLRQELDALRLYLQLESARLEHLFDYEIEVAGEIDPDEVFLPPMIIQPFVENAIWHGVRAIDYQGLITVKVEEPDDEWIKVSVIDNGVGRKHSKPATTKTVRRKHLGVSLSQERLRLADKRNHVTISDLHPETERGTVVEIFLRNNQN